MLGQFPAKVRRRVVVTGVGAVTPLGASVADTWTNLLLGRSAGRPLADVPYYVPPFCPNPKGILTLPCQVACPVLTPTESDLFAPSSRETRAHKFTLRAAEEALQDAGFKTEGRTYDVGVDPTRVGVNIGIGIPSVSDVTESAWHLFGDSNTCHYNRIGPFFVPKVLGNIVAGSIAQKYGFRGPNHSAVTACATGSHCIGDSARWIQYGDADVVLCGASEASITPVAIAGFCRMKSLSSKFNETPEKASRPFDADRGGFVMGEGSGMLILEEMEHAIARGAKIYGEVRGYGMSCDAYHVSSPHPQGLGAVQCIRSALMDGECHPSSVVHVNAHATGTPMGDEIELAAITNALRGPDAPSVGNARKDPPPVAICSNKGGFGHLLGAAGSVEAIIALMSLFHQVVPPNINLEHKIQHDATKVTLPVESVKIAGSAVVSTSFGFGGTNAALLFTHVAAVEKRRASEAIPPKTPPVDPKQ